MTRWFCVVALMAWAGAASAQTMSGLLSPDDLRGPSGKFYDLYTLQVQPGQVVTADLTSADMDTYLVLITPSGMMFENDDYEENYGHSHLEVIAPEGGQWLVYATTFGANTMGTYQLSMSVVTDPSVQAYMGSLDPTDPMMVDGSARYYDTFTLVAEVGQTIMVDLTAPAFDTYVTLQSPSGYEASNDDYEGMVNRSHLDEIADQSGVWTIVVTSFSGGTTGQYALTTAVRGESNPAAAPVNYSGRLEGTDPMMPGRGYYDEYTINAPANAPLGIDVTSTEFDTYLIAISPTGEQLFNDDWGGSLNSHIDATSQIAGPWRIQVTTYSQGEMGAYQLRIRGVAGMQ